MPLVQTTEIPPAVAKTIAKAIRDKDYNLKLLKNYQQEGETVEDCLSRLQRTKEVQRAISRL